MKRDIEKFIQESPICQRVKGEHCHYPGLLDPLPILDMAWRHISMDFVEGLPRSQGNNVILVVVDRFTKYSHFIALSHPFSVHNILQAFIDNIFKLHGLPVSIVTNRDTIFTSNFWQALFKSLGVKLNMSTAHHPPSDGQMERVNQCLEAYLRCMTFNEPKKWYS
uniref:Integrase catalytic domain-containing protein n=1 Tax=Triticum urartu TaxID=4572 RepID=A0A8R7QNI9_TRIUA